METIPRWSRSSRPGCTASGNDAGTPGSHCASCAVSAWDKGCAIKLAQRALRDAVVGGQGRRSPAVPGAVKSDAVGVHNAWQHCGYLGSLRDVPDEGGVGFGGWLLFPFAPGAYIRRNILNSAEAGAFFLHCLEVILCVGKVDVFQRLPAAVQIGRAFAQCAQIG